MSSIPWAGWRHTEVEAGSCSLNIRVENLPIIAVIAVVFTSSSFYSHRESAPYRTRPWRLSPSRQPLHEFAPLRPLPA